mgnify:CR=1 FL=1
MFKKDRENLIKKLSNIDLKELVVIEPTYTYKEHKKKTFIKVLEEIINVEEGQAMECACDQCGVPNDDPNLITAYALREIIKYIKDNSYDNKLFRNENTNKNKVEVV